MFDPFGGPLARAGERAERQHNTRPQWSPAGALASEGKFLEATLHTMPLKGAPRRICDRALGCSKCRRRHSSRSLSMAASFERRSVISALTFLRSIRMAKPPGRFRSSPGHFVMRESGVGPSETRRAPLIARQLSRVLRTSSRNARSRLVRDVGRLRRAACRWIVVPEKASRLDQRWQKRRANRSSVPLVGRAAYETARRLYPRDRIDYRNGAQIIARSDKGDSWQRRWRGRP